MANELPVIAVIGGGQCGQRQSLACCSSGDQVCGRIIMCSESSLTNQTVWSCQHWQCVRSCQPLDAPIVSAADDASNPAHVAGIANSDLQHQPSAMHSWSRSESTMDFLQSYFAPKNSTSRQPLESGQFVGKARTQPHEAFPLTQAVLWCDSEWLVFLGLRWLFFWQCKVVTIGRIS